MQLTPASPTTAQIAADLAAIEFAVRDEFLQNGPITDSAKQSWFDDRLRDISSGRNAVFFGAAGHPLIMVRIPAYNAGQLGAGFRDALHPAFMLNGSALQEVWIGKYQAGQRSGGVVSLPGTDPWHSINIDTLSSACRANGDGHHLMTNAEWAAVALMARHMRHPEFGNDRYGESYNDASQSGIRVDGEVPGDNSIEPGRTLTGSGPLTWRHDGTAFGISDLVGNVSEWSPGFRTVGGEIQILPNNDAATGDLGAGSTAWRAIMPDGTLVAPGTAGALHYDRVGSNPILNVEVTDPGTASSRFSSLTAADGVSVPEIAQLLMLAPNPDTQTNRGTLYIDSSVGAERMAHRGGARYYASIAGLAYLYGSTSRTGASGALGGRPAFAF